MTSASEPRAAPRRQGRPTRDQRGIRREALLAAASKLLSGRSPDEITRAELSREAGIDPALVRYYFGDMSSLLTEGMIDIFKQLKSRRAVTTSDAPLREQLRLRLESLIEVLVAHPHLHQLLMRPVLHVEPDKAAEVEALRRDYTLASFDSLQSISIAGSRGGREYRDRRQDVLRRDGRDVGVCGEVLPILRAAIGDARLTGGDAVALRRLRGRSSGRRSPSPRLSPAPWPRAVRRARRLSGRCRTPLSRVLTGRVPVIHADPTSTDAGRGAKAACIGGVGGRDKPGQDDL